MTAGRPHVKCAKCGIWWYEHDDDYIWYDGGWWCEECLILEGNYIAYGEISHEQS